MPKGFKTPKLCNLKRIGARKTWIISEVSESVVKQYIKTQG